jgi:hypothetical protein
MKPNSQSSLELKDRFILAKYSGNFSHVGEWAFVLFFFFLIHAILTVCFFVFIFLLN